MSVKIKGKRYTASGRDVGEIAILAMRVDDTVHLFVGGLRIAISPADWQRLTDGLGEPQTDEIMRGHTHPHEDGDCICT